MKKLKETLLTILEKIIWIFLTIFILTGCSKENTEVEPVRKLVSVTPSIVEIGDVVTIAGTGLNCATCYITFNSEDKFKTITASDTQIVVVLPTQHNEDVSVILWDSGIPIDTVAINLVGFFPLDNWPNLVPWSMQALDEHTFFTYNESGLYKTEDGGYNWSRLLTSEFEVRSFFFLTTQKGWAVSFHENMNKYIIYFTSNAGQSFQPIDTIECRFSEIIDKVFFKSPNEGYLLSSKGRIYNTSNNSSFEMVYEFPEDTDFSAGFHSLTVFNNTVMATGAASIGLSDKVPILITGKNNVFQYSTLNQSLGNVQLVDDNEAYVIKGSRLFFSDDTGVNWTEQSDRIVHDFYFLDKFNGVAISSEKVQSLSRTILFTSDKGANWQLGAKHPNLDFAEIIAFSGNVGLIGQIHPTYPMWKYVGD